VIGALAPFIELIRNLGTPACVGRTESGRRILRVVLWWRVPEAGVAPDMDPCSGSGFCQIKGSFLHSKTVPGVSTPKPEPHPVPAGCCALRDIVPAIDELST